MTRFKYRSGVSCARRSVLSYPLQVKRADLVWIILWGLQGFSGGLERFWKLDRIKCGICWDHTPPGPSRFGSKTLNPLGPPWECLQSARSQGIPKVPKPPAAVGTQEEKDKNRLIQPEPKLRRQEASGDTSP